MLDVQKSLGWLLLVNTANSSCPEFPLGEPAAAGWDLRLRGGFCGALTPLATQSMKKNTEKLD